MVRFLYGSLAVVFGGLFFPKGNETAQLLALFGVTAGQGVVWYTGQFYALTFLQSVLRIDWKTAYVLLSATLLLTTPLFVLFGWLSDRVGRKKITMAGCLLGVLTYVPPRSSPPT